jgi:hypothetical protein
VVLSLCAGDGRDVLQVLGERVDSSRVEVTLIELHPVLAQRAREFAAKAGLVNITVRTVDAGNTSAYGFLEVDYREFDQAEGERAALGSARYVGLSQALIAGRQLFTFWDEFAACQRSVHEICRATERGP